MKRCKRHYSTSIRPPSTFRRVHSACRTACGARPGCPVSAAPPERFRSRRCEQRRGRTLVRSSRWRQTRQQLFRHFENSGSPSVCSRACLPGRGLVSANERMRSFVNPERVLSRKYHPALSARDFADSNATSPRFMLEKPITATRESTHSPALMRSSMQTSAFFKGRRSPQFTVMKMTYGVTTLVLRSNRRSTSPRDSR